MYQTSSMESFNLVPLVSGRAKQNKTAENPAAANILNAIHLVPMLTTNGAIIAATLDPIELKLSPIFLIGVGYNSITIIKITENEMLAAVTPKLPNTTANMEPLGIKIRINVRTPIVEYMQIHDSLLPQNFTATTDKGAATTWKLKKVKVN